MTKRNWEEISRDIMNVLDPIPPVKKHIQHKQRPYDISTTNIVYKETNKFLHNKFYSKSDSITKATYYIRNNLTSKDVRITRDENLTIGNLKDSFENIGHCLSYKIADSYVSQLMFDFDCYKCKNNMCKNPIELELIEYIFDDVCNFINDNLMIDNAQSKCVVFKKSTSCNLHMYFNISVSLPVFELLRKRLMNTLDSKFTDKYLIDDVYILDLPYSTKNGVDIYKPIYSLDDEYLQFSCIPYVDFYDVELKLSIDQTYTTHINLGSFITNGLNWTECAECIKYLITPLEFKPFKTKNYNNLVNSIKLANKKFTTSYTLLQWYLDVNENEEFQNISDQEVLEIFNGDLKIFNGLLGLGDIISMKVYNNNNNNTHKLTSVLKFIMVDNCNYAFYAICSIIYHCFKLDDSDNLNTVKNEVLKILLILAKYNIQNNNDLLIQNLNMLNAYDCISNLESTFSDSNSWFLFLKNVVKLQTINNNMSDVDRYINLITLQLKVYDTQLSIVEDLVELCKLIMPIIKTSYDMNKFYYYIDGVYLTITNDKFFNQNSIQIQMIENSMRKMLQKLKESNQITQQQYNDIKLKQVWLMYFEQLEMTHPKFNYYDYFIATELGVFNTITGLYMKNTPLLIMNTKKNYCKTPVMTVIDLKTMKINELNKHLIFENQSQLYFNILNLLLLEQKKLFYSVIMIPGLLYLTDALYSADQEDSMLNLIYKMIIEDQSETNEKLLYFSEVLIHKYKLDVGNLVKFSKIIERNFQESGEFNRADLKRFCIGNAIEISTNSKFQQTEDCTLFDQLKTTICNFVPKTFVFAIIIAVFDIAHLSNRILTMVKWTTDKHTTKLSKNHLFYKYFNKQDFSMKGYGNIKRFIMYLTPNEQQVSESLLNLIQTISIMLNFDEIVIKDFLSAFSMIYHHSSPRKKIVLLIGSPKSGKSTYQNMLVDMHGRSIFSINNILQTAGQGPSPEIVNVHSNYLFSIIEMKSMTASTLKGLIGGDVVHKRLLHQNEMNELRPLAFAIAAANKIPSIHEADEAVKDRLAPFLFKCVFVDENSIDEFIDDNSLLCFINNFMISNTKFKTTFIAREFSNVLYEHFQNIRDIHGLIQPNLHEDNKMSEELISQTLIRNNIIYYLLNACGLVFNKKLFITYETLKDVMSADIEKYNETTKSKKFNWNYVKGEISMLFKNQETADGLGIRGLGLKTSLKVGKYQYEDCKFKMVEKKNGRVLVSEIKSHLYHIEKLKYSEVKVILQELIHKYKIYYDAQLLEFRDHILQV